MLPRTVLIFASLVFLAGGCAAPELAHPSASSPTAETAPGPMAAINESLQAPWKKLTQADRGKPAGSWEWVTALPKGASRAEIIVPEVAGPTLTGLLPQWPQPEIILASASSLGYRITAVNEMGVADCNQLHAAVARAVGSGKKITVTVGEPGQGAKPGPSIAVEPAQLVALSQAAAPKERLLRVTEDGNPWVVLRQDGVRCKMTARVERKRGLLQVALGLGVCWGPQTGLPREVRATCDGVPLQCLSVAGTLDALYGEPQRKEGTPGPEACSFAAVSEREDYRVPTNYKRLQHAASEAASGSSGPPPGPALATLPGLAYPGPAVLGDARALSGFLQQRQLYKPGEPERVGWIIFSGAALRHGSAIQLDIDLGQGPQRVTFAVPKA